MKNRDHLVLVWFNKEYIEIVQKIGGLYYVCVTNESKSVFYNVYGGYKHIGYAENRLLKSAKTYNSNPMYYEYVSTEVLQAHNYNIFDIVFDRKYFKEND